MPLTTVPLADRTHSAISQIRLTEPEQLLADGRILRFLSRLTTLSAGGRCAWELVFSSVTTPGGPALTATLITHTSLPGPQRAMLPDTAARTLRQQLAALQDSGIAAEEAAGPLPALRHPGLIAMVKEGSGLLSEEAEFTSGYLRQRLCAHPGNGMSLLLVESRWQEGELSCCACAETEARRAMLARDPVFDFALTLWGPDASPNAAWLRDLTLARLTTIPPMNAVLWPLCLRRDPWRLLTLLPPAAGPRPTLMTLSELLTLCGCPAEPGEMQRMCRMNWRDSADDALKKAQISLLPVDMTLQAGDLQYLGLRADSDVEDVLHMTPQMGDMLRMCVAILRQLGTLGFPGATGGSGQTSPLLGYLLPTVGHIYEQMVRECCYETMYSPYIAYATGRKPSQMTRVFLSTYDQGPGTRGYRLMQFVPGTSEPAMQSMIRERMIDDFTAHASIDGRKYPDAWWYELFSDMNAARAQRNGLTHELADMRTAEGFARSFLLDRPDAPSLLRRLLCCRRIETDFPVL